MAETASGAGALPGVHARRVERERRAMLVKAWLVNVLVFAYFFVLVLYFATGAGAVAEDATTNPLWYGGLLVGALLPALVWTRDPASAGRMIVERTNPLLKASAPALRRAWVRTRSGVFTLVVIALTLVLGWQVTEISLYDLFSREGLGGARRIFFALLQPKLEILGIVVQKMVETIFIAFVATLIAVPVAFVASFPTARNLMRHSASSLGVYGVLRFIFNFTRSVEPIIWAIIFSVWVGIGPFAGMLALMLHSISSLTKLYSEQVENVDQGPIEAIQATGAGRLQVIWYAVVPQIVLPYLSFTIYRWDINVRMATIIGLVGGGGVGTLLMQYQGHGEWNEVGTIVIVIALVVWLMDWLSAKVREAIA